MCYEEISFGKTAIGRTCLRRIHGDSRYYSEDAFKKLTGSNKELYIVPGAVHTDLYDKMDIIPFDKIEAFFVKNLK